MNYRKETPFLGGDLTADINPKFHYRDKVLYWKASYAADRMQEAYNRGKRDALEKKLNGETE